MFPIRPSNKISDVRVAQSRCSEILENAPTKIQSENYAHRVLGCKRVNSVEYVPLNKVIRATYYIEVIKHPKHRIQHIQSKYREPGS